MPTQRKDSRRRTLRRNPVFIASKRTRQIRTDLVRGGIMVERLACRTGFAPAGFLSVSLLIASTVALRIPAHAQPGAVYGGPGGRYFEYNCGPGRVLVGLRGSAGVLIDSIQAVCAGVDGRSVTIEANAQGPVIGNDRPFDQSIECPVGYAV